MELIEFSNDKFVIGKDLFTDLEIQSTSSNDSFYYFFDKKKKRLIKHFVLREGKYVDYLCQVRLIKRVDRFTPRLTLSIRDKNKRIQDTKRSDTTKANINLDECHDNFWELISFLKNL